MTDATSLSFDPPVMISGYRLEIIQLDEAVTFIDGVTNVVSGISNHGASAALARAMTGPTPQRLEAARTAFVDFVAELQLWTKGI
ncbi:MAG TPA: hypothetical protein VM639_20115 [Dongiaceae bacterium]|nr:hypothetical protein [Dongiaceae bacterium]